MARSLGCCWAEIFGVGLKSDMVCALQDKPLRMRISKRQTCSPEDPSIPYPAPHWGALLYMRQSGLHTGAAWLVASSCSLQTTHNKAFGCRMGSKEEVLHASRLFIAVSCLSIKKLLSLCTSCSERGVLPGLPQVVFIHVGKNIFHQRIPMSARLCLASIGVVWAAELLHPLSFCGTQPSPHQHSFCLSQGASFFSHLLTKLYFGKDKNSGNDENQQNQSWYHNREQREFIR